jgi:sec-independent protein translocase protein TatA
MVGVQELMIIALICVVLFGPRQLPKLGKAIGETIREFKGVKKAFESQVDDVTKDAKDATRAINKAVNE